MIGAPANDQYADLARKQAASERAAGSMLAASMRPDCQSPSAARQMAEEYAAEANEYGEQMRAWRLANGWAA